MNEASTVTFGAWLRWRRRSLDLTQAELALLIPCAKGTVRRLEADDLRPSKQLAERLAVTLGVLEPTRDRFLHFARTGWQAQSSLEQFTTNSSLLPPPNAADLPLAQSMRRYLLPVAPNPLLGRAHASSIAIEMLRQPEVRLVTLVGPPGVGKTRLALQIAEQIQPYFREGVCFVPLAPLNRADQVLPAIAQALDLLDRDRKSVV